MQLMEHCSYMYGALTTVEFAAPSSQTPAALSWLPGTKKQQKRHTKYNGNHTKNILSHCTFSLI